VTLQLSVTEQWRREPQAEARGEMFRLVFGPAVQRRDDESAAMRKIYTLQLPAYLRPKMRGEKNILHRDAASSALPLSGAIRPQKRPSKRCCCSKNSTPNLREFETFFRNEQVLARH
jgi:hypothetical protein